VLAGLAIGAALKRLLRPLTGLRLTTAKTEAEVLLRRKIETKLAAAQRLTPKKRLDMFPGRNKDGCRENVKMAKRNHNRQTETLSERLYFLAEQAREAAGKLPAGKDRDDLLRKAEMAEDAQRTEWVAVTGSQRLAAR
jgi:hypothetical protein